MPGSDAGGRRSSRKRRPASPDGRQSFELPQDVKSGKRSHLVAAELRAGLLRWPPEQIADYLIDVVGWDLDRRILELVVIAQVDVAHAVAGLRHQMEIAVNVKEVRWNEVREFVARLARVLLAIKSVGRDYPREAACLAWEYLQLVRGVADVVHGDDQLPNFYDEVLAVADDLSGAAAMDVVDRGKKLIDGYITGLGCGMGEPAIDRVKVLGLDHDQRARVFGYLQGQIHDLRAYNRKKVEELASQLAVWATGG